MKKILILFFVIFLTACNNNQPTENFVVINDQKIYVEMADTPAKRVQGLSNRKSLPQNHGMLFVFDDYNITNFWMKDMHFPIDIIWIKDDLIIGIQKNIPLQPLKYYTPSKPINYVLEVNAGYADRHNIKIGDRIKNLDLI